MSYKWVETKRPCGLCQIGIHQWISVGDCDCICHEVVIEGDRLVIKEKRL